MTGKVIFNGYDLTPQTHQIIGIDLANGPDKTVTTTFAKPSRLRRILRKLKIDRSQWHVKIVKQEIK